MIYEPKSNEGTDVDRRSERDELACGYVTLQKKETFLHWGNIFS
jgi:hypothetical protein